MTSVPAGSRWRSPTAAKFLVALALVEAALVLGDRYWLFGLERGTFRTVVASAALVAGLLVAWILWSLVARRLQFSLAGLLGLVLAAAVPCSWYQWWRVGLERQQAGRAAVRALQERLCTGESFRQIGTMAAAALASRPAEVHGESFAYTTSVSLAVEEDLGCGCCYGAIDVSLSADDLRPLAGFYQLEQLDLSQTGVTDEGLIHLAGLRKLRELNLSGNALAGPGLGRLAAFGELRRLELAGNRVRDVDLAPLAGMHQLEWLNLIGNRLDGSGLRHLRGLKNLQQLHLSGNDIGDAGLVHLGDLASLRSLTVGTAGRAAPLPSGRAAAGSPPARFFSAEGLRHLGRLPRLQQLSLASVRESGAATSDLAELPSLCGLQLTCAQGDVLTIGRTAGLRSLHVSDSRFRAVELRGPSRLEHLTLMGCRVEELFLVELSALECVNFNACPTPLRRVELRGLPKLKTLGVNGVPSLRDEHLAGLRDCAALKLLSFFDVSVGDSTLVWAATLPKLEQINVKRTRVTAAGIRQFRAARPEVRLECDD